MFAVRTWLHLATASWFDFFLNSPIPANSTPSELIIETGGPLQQAAGCLPELQDPEESDAPTSAFMQVFTLAISKNPIAVVVLVVVSLALQIWDGVQLLYYNRIPPI